MEDPRLPCLEQTVDESAEHRHPESDRGVDAEPGEQHRAIPERSLEGRILGSTRGVTTRGSDLLVVHRSERELGERTAVLKFFHRVTGTGSMPSAATEVSRASTPARAPGVAGWT